MDTLNCIFSTPLTFENLPPVKAQDHWQYSEIACDLPAQATITDGTNTFYLRKTIDFGDLVVVAFLVIFLMLEIFKLVFDFFMPKVFKVFNKTM